MSPDRNNPEKRTDWDKVANLMFAGSLDHFSKHCDEPTREGKSRRLRLLVELYIERATMADLDCAISSLESGIAHYPGYRPGSSQLTTRELAAQEAA